MPFPWEKICTAKCRKGNSRVNNLSRTITAENATKKTTISGLSDFNQSSKRSEFNREEDIELATIHQLSAARVVKELSTISRQIQLGLRRVLVTHHGVVIGFLLPLSDVNEESGVPIAQAEEISLTEFRQQLENPRIPESDCIYITQNTRRLLVFVNPRLYPYLPLKII